MQRCLDLAIKGIRTVSPNPMVGCVIVHKNKIIGEGYHEAFGKEHAEVKAINQVQDKKLLKESKMYVSLEPCAHTGKTPPCSGLIIKHQIPEVLIGIEDPNPKVSGKGIAKLEKSGIKVKVGILKPECFDLNKRFLSEL